MGISKCNDNGYLAYVYLDRITPIPKKRRAIEFRNSTARFLFNYSDLLYPLTIANNSSGVTNDCSPVVMFFNVNLFSFISFSPTMATNGMFLSFA